MILTILLVISAFIVISISFGVIGYLSKKGQILDLSREAQEEISKATIDFTKRLQEIKYVEEERNEYK